MGLEAYGIEGEQVAAFLKHLISQFTDVDSHVAGGHQVALDVSDAHSGAPTGEHPAVAQTVAEQPLEVASTNPYVFREPNVLEINYEKDALKYLEDLEASAQRTLDELRATFLTPISLPDGTYMMAVESGGVTRQVAEENIAKLEALIRQIESARARGLPNDKIESIVKDFYDQVHEIQLKTNPAIIRNV